MKTLFLTLAAFISLNLHSQVLLEQTTVDTATVIQGLDIPWEIQWGPDDRLWVTERYGRVSRVHPETGDQDVILDISDQVLQSGESGLLGMALHPDFESYPYVYLAYTYQAPGEIKVKIVRFEYIDGMLTDETILLDGIPGSYNHDGCRLVITPDLKLLASTGDALNQASAQDIDALSGKILRLHLDGSVPADNPWPGNPVWSFGHRNAQGLFLAANGILYSSEHGPSTDDELNIIEKGRNYGWPNVHGFCDLPEEITFCTANNVQEPLVAWTPTIATSDIVFYDHPSIPEWQNSILLTTLKNKRLYALKMDGAGSQVVSENQYFINYWGRLRDVCIGPNGEIYLATNGEDWTNTEPFTHRIIKVWNPEFTSVGQLDGGTVGQMEIYPNPASAVTSFRFRVSGSDQVTLKIFDLQGREVATLLDEWMPAGEHVIEFETSALLPGVYLLRKKTSEGYTVQKFLKS